MLSVNVVNTGMLRAPLLFREEKESETVLYLFDFLFVAVGAKGCFDSPPSALTRLTFQDIVL